MTTFQKELLRASLQNEEQRALADKLFRAMEIENVDFDVLAIPVIDLRIEDVLPVGQTSDFIKSAGDKLENLMHASIVFDLYFPSKKWVGNIEQMALRDSDYLRSMVRLTVQKMLDHVYYRNSEFGSSEPFIVDNKLASLAEILTDATIKYLNENGIVHILDYNISLRQDFLNNNNMLISEDKIDNLIYWIKKQK